MGEKVPMITVKHLPSHKNPVLCLEEFLSFLNSGEVGIAFNLHALLLDLLPNAGQLRIALFWVVGVFGGIPLFICKSMANFFYI